MGDDDNGGSGRMVVTPTVGLIEEPAPPPETIAPQPDVSSVSIGALTTSTEKLMASCALGTSISPPQYQSNNSAGLSSGWATKPSSDMHI